jgi:oxalate decarboxylase/phosphoglucose isomerase-like protein (cupin superfamily)
MLVKFFGNEQYRFVPGYQTLKAWWRKRDTPNDVIIVVSKRPLKLGLCYRDEIAYSEKDGGDDFRLKISYVFTLKEIQEADEEMALQDFAVEQDIWLSQYVSGFYQSTKEVYASEIVKWQSLAMRARQLHAYITFLREKPPPSIITMALPLCLACERPTTEGEIETKQPLCGIHCQDIYYDEMPMEKEKKKKDDIFVLDMEKAIGNLNQKRHILYTSEEIQLSIQRLKKKGSRVRKEIHKSQAQFIRVEKGSLTVTIYTPGRLTVKILEAQGEDSIIIPANRFHILRNESSQPVIFYTIYAPPAHSMEEMRQDQEEANRLEKLSL